VGVEDASLDSPRMPRVAVLVLSLMLGAGCAVLVSCGSDDEGSIPSTNADEMLAELDRARQALETGDCEEVAESAQQVSDNAESLDTTVDAEVRTGLVDGAAHLAELANDPSQCEPTTTTTTEEKPEKPEPTTTETTEPTTTEETTTTTTTAEAEPAEPEGEGEDGGPAPKPPGHEPGPGPGTGGVGDGE
jgi:hypothetical protein